MSFDPSADPLVRGIHRSRRWSSMRDCGNRENAAVLRETETESKRMRPRKPEQAAGLNSTIYKFLRYERYILMFQEKTSPTRTYPLRAESGGG
ncbi:CGNR zinc finger domain-containing protein [Paenibacillus alkalitolerans]|uniref:CGNR zinc finger domain-containing protein n=1 Tax=Paenibacillus alkalitolerans TaxID=2799335 RepID=UPI003898DD9D